MSYASEVLADSPVAYWKCDETSGNLSDSSGNGNTLEAVNTPVYSAVGPGVGNYGITLASASSQSFRVTGAPASAFDLGDVLTLEIWVKKSVNGITQGLFSKGVGTYYFKDHSSGVFYFDKENFVSLRHSTTGITDTTTWHHCVVTKNGTTCVIYYDGSDVTVFDGDATLVNSADIFSVGAKVDTGVLSEYLDGTVSQVAVYNTALSAARVLAHYAAMFPSGTMGSFRTDRIRSRRTSW